MRFIRRRAQDARWALRKAWAATVSTWRWLEFAWYLCRSGRARDNLHAILLRAWCRDVRAHWRLGYVATATAGVQCTVCGARFRSLAEAGTIEKGWGGSLARRDVEDLVRRAAMEDRRHGGARYGEHYERVRRVR
jgi:hypothetical protein